MPQFRYTAMDFLNADTLLDYLAKDREAHFITHGEKMPREEAVKNFNERAALVIVRGLLIDAAEKENAETRKEGR